MFFSSKKESTESGTENTTPVAPEPMPAPDVSAQKPVEQKIIMPETQSQVAQEQEPVEQKIIMPNTQPASTSSSSFISEPLERPVYNPMPTRLETTSQIIETPLNTESLPKIEDVWFSDLYFTPEKVAYVHDKKSSFGLKVFEAEDLMDFHKALEEGFQGSSSYSLRFNESLYRVERIKTISGIHYTVRRMPKNVPDVYQLGMPEILVNHLTSLNKATGLILLCGPTGMGKTTTATALLFSMRTVILANSPSNQPLTSVLRG